ncbi:MAG TPA: Fe-S cluster assembly protein SufB, partial [Oceanospirillales bacterium]|nr:Fe-S cluster assembly protein SufB [Oceanospirillales bacterium]
MTDNAEIDRQIGREYEAGFTTDVESATLAPGLNEDTVRFISAKKGEPEWLLEWRLKAFAVWKEMTPPNWAQVQHLDIDFQDVSYYSEPKSMEDRPQSLDEVDPELLATYEKLGIPVHEQAALAGVAVDVVFDSVSLGTTFRETLAESGVIFMPISEAVHKHPELVQKYMGTVVPQKDNYYAALNSAVFSDGSFVYIPKGVRCPMELSTYFRINEEKTGQFERTLIIADEGSHVS